MSTSVVFVPLRYPTQYLHRFGPDEDVDFGRTQRFRWRCKKLQGEECPGLRVCAKQAVEVVTGGPPITYCLQVFVGLYKVGMLLPVAEKVQSTEYDMIPVGNHRYLPFYWRKNQIYE